MSSKCLMPSKFPAKESEFYFDSGSSTGPISSSSSTNNDSLSSNVSSSESDCESKPTNLASHKKSGLSALAQLPPSSSSSVNGDELGEYQSETGNNSSSSNQIQISFKKFNSVSKRKPTYRLGIQQFISYLSLYFPECQYLMATWSCCQLFLSIFPVYL